MKSNEEFIKEVLDLVGGEFEFLEAYRGCKTKLPMRHNSEKCQFHIHYISPNDFLSKGNRCPKCSGKYRLTENEFKLALAKATNDEYELISSYEGKNTKIHLRHFCGHKWWVRPVHILDGNSNCPKCSSQKMAEYFRLSIDRVRYFIESNNYKLLSKEYLNARQLLDIECAMGHVYQASYNHFQNGNRCPECDLLERSEKQRFPLEELVNLLRLEGLEIVRWIDEYKSRNSRYIQRCSNGHEVERSVASFKAHGGCPECNDISKGEQKILNYINSKSINYVSEYTFDDCLHKRKLPFDFAIFNDDGCLQCLIEYDGQQHFNPIDYFGGEEDFQVVQIRDTIKNTYCLDNNIKLILIPYWDYDNIESILQDAI